MGESIRGLNQHRWAENDGEDAGKKFDALPLQGVALDGTLSFVFYL